MPRQADIPFVTAMDMCRTAIAIADAQAPDCPLVYVNRAFQDLFGYEVRDAVGRNCRFLQGSDREQPGLDAIRDAIDQGGPGSAVIRNYSSDGTVILNELSIGPVRDEQGRVTHYVGSQCEVPYESLRTLRDDALVLLSSLTRREREVLSHLLEGESNKAIARTMGISVRTAETHRCRILRKMGVENVTQLVPFAIAAEAFPDLPRRLADRVCARRT